MYTAAIRIARSPMYLRSIRTLLSKARALRHDCRGNVAMMYGLMIVPVLGAAGMAIDYSREASVQNKLQSALDATALSISKNASTQTAAQLTASAQSFFNATFNVSGVATPTVSATYTPSGTSSNATVQVAATAVVPTSFLGIFGITSNNVSGSSTTTWGMTRLRVSLVLDNTGSMASAGKLTALKTATHNLLNQLKAAAVNNGDVYVSIVPFAKVVNVGTSNVNASWIDWTDWEAAPANSMPSGSVGPGSSCPYGTNKSPYGYTCTTTPLNGANSTSTIPSSGTYAGYVNPGPDSTNYNAVAQDRYYNGGYNSVGTQTCTTKYGKTTCTTGAPYTHTWVPNSHSTWDGSIMDRAQDYDTNNTVPTSANTQTLFPATQATDIDATPSPILPLTYDWTALGNAVDGMVAGGGTNQTVGLAWGWQSLTAGAPLNPPAEDPNYQYNHVIIMLTDGLNTEDRWYGNGYDWSSQVDAREQKLCTNLVAAKVTAYFVQVNTDGEATSSVLQSCANNSNGLISFQLLTNSSQIITTFQQIGATLSQLRVSR
jgi:Flp pilus assembly protein TadG